MATKKISELTEATSLTLNDLLPIVNGNETKNTKLEALKNFLSLGYEGHTIYELNSTVNTLDIDANTKDFADVIPKLNTLVNSHFGETLFIVIRDPSKANLGSDNYLLFLRSGGNDYPLNILKKCGIDIVNDDTIDKALKVFDDTLDEFIKVRK